MSLKAFLENYRTSSEPCSCYGMGSYQGKYYVPDEKLSEFWQLFYQEVFIHKRPVHLIEKHTNIGPIVIDFDFRYTQNTTNRSYTNHFIEDIVKIYNEVITRVVDISEEEAPEAIQAFIFERQAPYVQKGVLKDGIHIVYPFVSTEPAAQLFIREQVLKHPDLDSVLGKIPMDHSMTPSKVIDLAVIYQNGWFLYGASKPNLAPYRLTRILDSMGRECPINDYPDDKLPELLSIRNKKECIPIKEAWESAIEPFRNRILKKSNTNENSTFSSTMALLHSTQSKGIQENGQKWVPIQKNGLDTSTQQIQHVGAHDEEIQTIMELVTMLNPERADNYDDWIRVGWCLHTINPHSEELFLIWDEFSRKSRKYDENACEKEWSKMRPTGLTIGSLHFWAQQDNPEEYSLLRERDLKHWIMNSLTGTHVDVAKVLYRMYRYQYICSSIRFRSWYEFIGSRWREIDDGIGLRNKIPNELVQEYQKLRAIYYEKIQQETRTLQNLQLQAHAIQLQDNVPHNQTTKKGNNSVVPDKDLVDEITERIQRYRDDSTAIDGLLPKLKTTTFIDNVMRECRGMFYVDKFQNQLDANPNLIGFENGVYELNTHIFRDGRPEDFISLTTGINYIPYDPNSEYSKSLNLFISQLHPIKENRDYLLTFLSSCLEGANADESLHIWTGRGGNGKSKINELFINTIGGYAAKLPISLLTQKRAASNAANPELMDTKGKRYCYMEEPGEGEVLNVGFMKELTGGDRIKARGLYRDFMEFKPQFKMVLLCNDLPKVPPFDDGTWRRLKVLEFRSRFVAEPKADNEYPRDRYLSEKLTLWRETFMGLLIHYYKIYRTQGLVIPACVLRFTKEYQKGMDQYHEYIDAKIKFTQNKDDRLELNAVYDDFKNWYEDNIQANRVPSKRELKKYFEKKYTTSYVSPSLLFGFIWNKEEEES